MTRPDIETVHAELLRLAHRELARHQHSATLETRALVNEVYLKLFDRTNPQFANRERLPWPGWAPSIRVWNRLPNCGFSAARKSKSRKWPCWDFRADGQAGHARRPGIPAKPALLAVHAATEAVRPRLAVLAAAGTAFH